MKNLIKPCRSLSALSAFLVALFSLGACASSHAVTIIAYEGFNYSAGTMTGNNGGTGWSSSWSHVYTSGASQNANTTGLSYTGLATVGGSMTWGSGGNGISENTRTLPLMNSGVVYFQFLSQLSNSGGGTPNIRLSNSGAGTGAFGGNGGTYSSVMSILDASLNAASDGSSSTSASLSSLNLTIVRIDYVNNVTNMWVNPNLATFDYENPTSPNANANFAPVFNTISVYSRSGSYDEITVMTIPEPSSMAFVSLAVSLALFGRRRRQGGC
ncbi:MAG: PEP-CTERM sorting domain-containing protein [Verrucomicrobiota bacterium]